MYNQCDQNTPQQCKQTCNQNVHFIAPNPPTFFNPISVCPRIDSTAYVGPFSSVIGDVTIRKNVFIAPNVSIRADEGTPFYIDCDTNLQEGVTLHGLANGRVMHNGELYSIYVGKRVSCAHGSLLHGPCKIGNDVFVGFRATVFNAVVGDGCYISTNAFITGGVIIANNRFIPAGCMIDTQEKADQLEPVSTSKSEFAEEVQQVNRAFSNSYPQLYGATTCSWDMACNAKSNHQVLK